MDWLGLQKQKSKRRYFGSQLPPRHNVDERVSSFLHLSNRAYFSSHLISLSASTFGSKRESKRGKVEPIEKGPLRMKGGTGIGYLLQNLNLKLLIPKQFEFHFLKL